MGATRYFLVALIGTAMASLGLEGGGLEGLDCRDGVEVQGRGEARLLCGEEARASGLRPGERRTRDGAVERMAVEAQALLSVPVEVNGASVAELDSLPGIGPVLAGRVLKGRPYQESDELLEVKGIGPKKLAAMKASGRLAFSSPPSR